jgi:hypothetical protein
MPTYCHIDRTDVIENHYNCVFFHILVDKVRKDIWKWVFIEILTFLNMFLFNFRNKTCDINRNKQLSLKIK